MAFGHINKGLSGGKGFGHFKSGGGFGSMLNKTNPTLSESARNGFTGSQRLDEAKDVLVDKVKKVFNEGFSHKQSIQIQNILDNLPIDISEDLGNYLDKGDVSGFTEKLDKLLRGTKRDWDKGLHNLLRDLRSQIS